MKRRSILIILISLKSANQALQLTKLYINNIRRERILASYKIALLNFLIRALGRPKDATWALIERRNQIEFIIDYIYNFKVFLVSWRL